MNADRWLRVVVQHPRVKQPRSRCSCRCFECGEGEWIRQPFAAKIFSQVLSHVILNGTIMNGRDCALVFWPWTLGRVT